jgi:hypothetical protein
MRPSVKTVAAIFRSHPHAADAQRLTGMTPEQAAAQLLIDMDRAPNDRARDALFSHTMAAVGIFTTGVDAFNKGTQQMLDQMGTDPARIDREARRMSEDSRRSPQFVEPERIKHLHGVARASSLQQGLSDRMRERDRHQAAHEPAAVPTNHRAEQGREDSRDLRAALSAAVASSVPDDSHVTLRHEHESLRDTLTSAFDVHEALDTMRDPWGDPALLSASDAV